MIHSITDSFCFWIDNFYLQLPKSKRPHESKARELGQKLQRVTSLDELSSLLEKTSKLAPPPRKLNYFQNVFHFQNTPDPFFEKINGWRNLVKTHQALSPQSICNQLETLTFQIKTQPLMNLLIKVLQEPKCVLHGSLPSLFLMIQNLSKLQAVVNYLEVQPDQVSAKVARRGTFEALLKAPVANNEQPPQIDADVEACLGLLRNNNASKNTTDEEGTAEFANHLLQQLISIYIELNAEPNYGATSRNALTA